MKPWLTYFTYLFFNIGSILFCFVSSVFSVNIIILHFVSKEFFQNSQIKYLRFNENMTVSFKRNDDN